MSEIYKTGSYLSCWLRGTQCVIYTRLEVVLQACFGSWIKERVIFISCMLVVTNASCGLAVILCGFISLLIGRETINIPEIFSGVHGFTGKTVIIKDNKLKLCLMSLSV